MTINDQFDAIDESQIALPAQATPTDILKVIGLFAPILIGMLQLWKVVPGLHMKSRNAKIDIAIFALKASSIFYFKP